MTQAEIGAKLAKLAALDATEERNAQIWTRGSAAYKSNRRAARTIRRELQAAGVLPDDMTAFRQLGADIKAHIDSLK